MATAGCSRRKSHGGKDTHRSLMWPPCGSTPIPRVATLLKGSFLQRRCDPDLFQANVRVKLRKSKSRRVSSLETLRYSALDGFLQLRRIQCRKLAMNSETIIEAHEHRVRVLCAVVSAERAWDSNIYHEAFHDRENGGRALPRASYVRWRREALSRNITTYRDPPKNVGEGSTISMWTSISSLRRSPRRVVRSGCPISFLSRTNRRRNQYPIQANPMPFRCRFRDARTGMWARE